MPLPQHGEQFGPVCVGIVAAAGGCAERFLKAERFPVAASESCLGPMQFIGKIVERAELPAFEHRPHVRLERLLFIWCPSVAPAGTRRRLAILARCLRDTACEPEGREHDGVQTSDSQESLHRDPFLALTVTPRRRECPRNLQALIQRHTVTVAGRSSTGGW